MKINPTGSNQHTIQATAAESPEVTGKVDNFISAMKVPTDYSSPVLLTRIKPPIDFSAKQVSIAAPQFVKNILRSL